MTRTFLTSFALMVLVTTAGAGDGKTEPGFTSLFNGKNLDGWHIMNKGQFSVKDGVIFLNKGRGWLRSDKMYKDFELRLDFRFLNKGADSGIFLGASEEGKDWPAKNYQVQTADGKSLGTVFVAGHAKIKLKRDADKLAKAMKKVAEWQSFIISLKGGHLEVQLNGELVTTADGLSDQPGFIGLQGEGGILEFK